MREASHIKLALDLYYDEYGGFPDAWVEDKDFESSLEIARALSGENARGIMFVRGFVIDGNGMRDPWGGYYQIGIKTNDSGYEVHVIPGHRSGQPSEPNQ